jgi:hypothetical protein
MRGFSMAIRPVASVTPCGAMAWKSGSTTVLVDGTSTPNFAR